MKFHSIVWIALGLTLIFALLLAYQQPTLAQSAKSACINCHETQEKKPVRADGQWHIQHNMLACEVCHAGNPAAETQEDAHAGQTTNPLEAGTSCALCHPDTVEEYIAIYQVLITPEALPTAEVAPALDNTPAAEATPTAQAGECRVVATECVEATGPDITDITPTVQASPTLVITATAPVSTTSATLPVSTPSNGTPAVGAAPVGGAPAGGVSGFSWMQALQFTRGPLFKTAFWFFVVGMLLRLAQALRSGWRHRVTVDKNGRAAGAAKSFITGLLMLPFIPGLKGAFRRRPVMYLAGGLFHLGLLAVILFSKTHMSAWKGMVGFGWPVLPPVVVSWLAAIGIVAMLALLINRIVDPVLRLISGPAEWLNWLAVFLPMITGFVLARKLWLPYEVSFSIHMLLVDILLIWIPLSRISHFVFYFFSRAIHGVEFNSRRVAAP